MTRRMRTRSIMLLCVCLGSAAPLAAQQPAHEWLAVRYEYTHVDDTDPWQYGSLEAGARRATLTPIARVNWASRFDEQGYQLEADLYPAKAGLGYAYLSAAYSDDAPFPDLRLAGELFATLPRGYEASAGLIHLDFGGDDVSIVVASLARYVGSYWISLRPSYTTVGSDLAATLTARRYLGSDAEFVTVRVFAGSTPEEIETRGTRLETFGLQADAQLDLAPRWSILPLASIAREEIGGDAGESRLRFSAGIGAMYRF